MKISDYFDDAVMTSSGPFDLCEEYRCKQCGEYISVAVSGSFNLPINPNYNPLHDGPIGFRRESLLQKHLIENHFNKIQE